MKKKSLAERFIFQAGYPLAFGVWMATLFLYAVTKFWFLLFLVLFLVGFLVFGWAFFLHFNKEWGLHKIGMRHKTTFPSLRPILLLVRQFNGA